MRECFDKRFKAAIHSYELGLLNGEELIEFERHLLDCEYCFNEVMKFQKEARHLVRSEKIANAIREFVVQGNEPDFDEVRDHPKVPHRPLWRSIIPIAALLILILLIKPWRIQFSPTNEALAAQNRMLITCFENLSTEEGDQRLGEIITSLLITDLAESQYIQVISSQYIDDQLRNMGIEQACPLNHQIAFELARKTNARWLLTGNIIRERSSLLINSQLIDVSTGNILAAQQILGDSVDNHFSVTDRLAIEVKKDLYLPRMAYKEEDIAVSSLTTHSDEAYACYLDGINSLNQLLYPQAAEAFHKALEYDSTYAMAYYHLAEIESPRMIYTALKHSDSASLKDRLYIESRAAQIEGDQQSAIQKLEEIINLYPFEKNAYQILGNCHYVKKEYEIATEYYLRAIEIDPLYVPALNQLAYSYAHINDYQNAIRTVNKYIEIAPDEFNPYDTRAEILACYGDLNQAINALEKAAELEPNFLEAWLRLAVMNAFNSDYESTKICFNNVLGAGNFEQRAWSRLFEACALVRQGLFNPALEKLEALMEKTDSLPANADYITLALSCKISILHEIGRLDEAVKLMENTIKAGNKFYPNISAGFNPFFIIPLTENGNNNAAQKMYEGLRTYAKQDRIQWHCYLAGKGYFEFSQDNYDKAVSCFEEIAFKKQFPQDNNFFEYHYMSALSHLNAGNTLKAIREFELIHDSYTYQRILWSVWDIKSYYYLGVAYEKLGMHDKAVLNYEIFIEFWNDSEYKEMLVKDAQTRLANLKTTYNL